MPTARNMFADLLSSSAIKRLLPAKSVKVQWFITSSEAQLIVYNSSSNHAAEHCHVLFKLKDLQELFTQETVVEELEVEIEYEETGTMCVEVVDGEVVYDSHPQMPL